MKIKTYLAVSIDGYITTQEGWPVQLSMPAFTGRTSYGLPEFLADCRGAVMGRTTFLPALEAPEWPWPGLRVFVLTSSPLPEGTPAEVVSAPDPAELRKLMEEADLGGDVHLVGGQRTLDAFLSIGALDQLGVLTVPRFVGSGVRLTADGSPFRRFELRSSRTFPDGCLEQVYLPAA
ncbi:dihydrofolate reductase family protein [Amycolatopsis pithecellobii]|uniref:Riboflavin biosynthesis protein RibD n=1 Tax=Amycolatopsis pithecellobii TaxID=664692 RepID=A0A6N7ZAL4_9PSEU|nr:dihydrofolate reductase family protein [Amycolatopsis pithecellobii]MTD58791.1 riboflavin biosynthesis protein RibD [Amycolatopsis pithecellobii]